MKKQVGGFLGALLAPLAVSVQPVISSVVIVISGNGFRTAGKDIWINIFSSTPFFEQLFQLQT